MSVAAAPTEAALLEWIRTLGEDSDEPVDVHQAFANVKKFGVDVLVQMCVAGVNTFKKSRLLNNGVFASLYTAVYLSCTRGTMDGPQDAEEANTKLLYAKHGEETERFLTDKVLPDLDRHSGEFLLTAFCKHWDQQKIFTEWMRRMFQYLDRRGPFNASADMPSTTSSGLRKFKDIVFDRKKGLILDTVQDFIDRERAGEVVDRSLLKSVIELFIIMGIAATKDDFKSKKDVEDTAQKKEAGANATYVDDFEQPFLNRTKQFYRRCADQWINEDSTPVYLNKAEKALENETNRVAAYLNPSTEPKLISVLERELLERYMEQLIEKDGSGLRVLLRDTKLDDMARMFRMFKRVGGLDRMARVVELHIEASGKAVIAMRVARIEAKAAAIAADPKKKRSAGTDAHDPEFVDAMVDLHEQMKQLVSRQFDGHVAFQKAHGRAFRTLMAQDTTEPGNADVLSAYCDNLLKRAKKLDHAEVDRKLDAVVQLFDYLQDQDVFAEVYRGQLAKRLLAQKSSLDDEKGVVQKLKMRCGGQFTQKMEGMFHDLELGVTAKLDYKRVWDADRSITNKFVFDVTVLKAGYWPTFLFVEATLPPVFKDAVDHFDAYYRSKDSKRRLQWVHSQGTAELVANLGDKASERKIVAVSTLQAFVLLFFNKRGNWTFGELLAETGLEEEILKRVLHPLYSIKGQQIVAKDPPGAMSSTDTLSFNTSVRKHPKKRLVYPTVPLAASGAKKRVEHDRRFVIDATVVRIMKARRELLHNDLVAEVFSQCHFFKPNQRQVKSRIEDLIAREYLARIEGAKNKYRYLA